MPEKDARLHGNISSSGLANITVKVKRATESVVLATTTTDANGNWFFKLQDLVTAGGEGLYDIEFSGASITTFSLLNILSGGTVVVDLPDFTFQLVAGEGPITVSKPIKLQYNYLGKITFEMIYRNLITTTTTPAVVTWRAYKNSPTNAYVNTFGATRTLTPANVTTVEILSDLLPDNYFNSSPSPGDVVYIELTVNPSAPTSHGLHILSANLKYLKS